MTTLPDRMPPLSDAAMDASQRAAAEALIAGPRKAVRGPFIPLLRSPELMARLEKVGEYLRFASALPPRLGELATLIVARRWSQQFEWAVHAPLALQAGTAAETIEALRHGARPTLLSDEEALVYDLVRELEDTHGVSDATYARAVATLGERGVIDLIGIVGYFTLISMVLNVAHTPAEPGAAAQPLPALPL